MLLKCRNDEQLRQWLSVIIEVKESATKIDLISTPQTPRMDNNNPLLHYDEDEEDCYDDYDDEGDEYSRKSYHMYRGNEVSSRKASLSSQSSSSTTARHFMNGVPGMTLPPLPRSPTSIPALSNASVSTFHSTDTTLYSPSYPSSPPGSHPSSPTRPNHGINPSGELWQRRQGEKEEKKIHHVRARSQSSPNIQRPIPPSHSTTPDLPTNSTYKRKSNGYRYEVTAPPTPSPLPGEITKVKVHYFGAIYVVVVPTDIEYDDLQRRIESKIKLCGQEFETSILGLKYEDEDGDLITISSSEDVQMGFENKGPNNAVNLYVTS